MNATDTYERVMSGFGDLLAQLRGVHDYSQVSNRIKANTAARELAQRRMQKEYADLGLIPPSDIALSITARRVMADVDAERNRQLEVDRQARESAA